MCVFLAVAIVGWFIAYALMKRKKTKDVPNEVEAQLGTSSPQGSSSSGTDSKPLVKEIPGLQYEDIETGTAAPVYVSHNNTFQPNIHGFLLGPPTPEARRDEGWQHAGARMPPAFIVSPLPR